MRFIRCAQGSWKCGNKVMHLTIKTNLCKTRMLYFSVQKFWHAECISVMKFVMKSVRHVRRRASKNVYAGTKHRSVTAVIWNGLVKKLAINYLNVENTDAKLNAIVETTVSVQTDQ